MKIYKKTLVIRRGGKKSELKNKIKNVFKKLKPYIYTPRESDYTVVVVVVVVDCPLLVCQKKQY